MSEYAPTSRHRFRSGLWPYALQKAEAEVERLREECASRCSCDFSDAGDISIDGNNPSPECLYHKRLRGERDRYREALEDIDRFCSACDYDREGDHRLARCHDPARRALHGEEEGEG